MISSTSRTAVADSVRRSYSALHYPELKQIVCAAEHGKVTLTGRVGSYYLKQMAQSVALRVPGVRSVVNQVQVDESHSRRSRQTVVSRER